METSLMEKVVPKMDLKGKVNIQGWDQEQPVSVTGLNTAPSTGCSALSVISASGSYPGQAKM